MLSGGVPPVALDPGGLQVGRAQQGQQHQRYHDENQDVALAMGPQVGRRDVCRVSCM